MTPGLKVCTACNVAYFTMQGHECGVWRRSVAEARVQRLMKRLDEFVVEEQTPKTWQQLITPADALWAHELRVRLD